MPLQVGSHQRGVERQHHLPYLLALLFLMQPTIPLAPMKPLIQQHPQILLSMAAFNPFIPQPALIPEVVSVQVEHLVQIKNYTDIH